MGHFFAFILSIKLVLLKRKCSSFIIYKSINIIFIQKFPKSLALFTKLLMCSAMLKVLQTEDLACKKKHSFGAFFFLEYSHGIKLMTGEYRVFSPLTFYFRLFFGFKIHCTCPQFQCQSAVLFYPQDIQNYFSK